MLLVRITGNKVAVISRSITLKDISKEKGAAGYESPTGAKKITIDEETMRNIKANPRLLQHVIHK